jgi:glutaredoxin-like protein
VSSADRSAAIRSVLAAVNSAVRLVFFEQSIGCESCTPTRQLLEHIADLSPYVTVETCNLIFEKDRAAQHGIDRVPAIVVCSPGRDRIRFYGAPFGHELMSLLEAIRLTASGESGLTTASRARLASIAAPVSLQVFYTPTCTFCPQMVNLANRLAIERPLITATAIDATQYPDLVRRYNVNGVPKTIINDALEIVGAATETEVVEAVVQMATEK